MTLSNPKQSVRFTLLILLLMTLAAPMRAQNDSGSAATLPPSPQPRSLPPPQSLPTPQQTPDRTASAAPITFVGNVLSDQKQIWTAPFKAKVQDLNWIVPMIGLTAGMINADAELSSRIDTTGSFSRHASTISNAGLAAALGGSGGLYLLGKARTDDHQRETGILGIEAATNSLIVTEALKIVTLRNRPTDGNGKGEFFQNGSLLNSSFPSAHAMLTWSVASVLAHEYPGALTQAISYGAATTVSLARVYGKDHFPSEVIVGSALGWLIGRQAYASHHNPELPGGGYGTFHRDVGSGETMSANMRFSAYVPMDSWVYPAFDRLAALGVVNSNFAGLRPWTRAECARLLEEAQGAIDEYSGDEGSRLYGALEQEFSPELQGTIVDNVGIDSVYGRVVGISGHPLTDDYHFASTIVNDYGRPFQNGGNGQAGFESSGSAGMLGFYMRGEYEHAPSAPGYSQPVQDLVQFADQKPPQPAFSIPTFDQFRLLDTYIALNLAGWQTSFGKQSLWLGPTRDPYLQSINAEPMYMFRIDQTTPSQLPWIFKYLGPLRTVFWVGKLTGQHFVNTQNGSIAVSLGRTLPRQPMVNGFKVNFKPTPNFEFGVGRTGLWGGPDFPITASTTKRSLFSSTNAAGGLDPGDRRSTFDFTYRIPGVRKWLTLYEDSIVEDEISPIGYPRRAAHDSGLYMSQVPGIPHLDARVEGAYTNLPGLIEPPAGGFFYWNTRYLDGYTNKGHILGDGTVGRQGIALRAESTYWFASDKTIQLGYRSNIADTMFLQGGNFRDIYLGSEWSLNKKLALKSFLQYEYWNFPLLSGGNKDHDFTAAFQVTYRPDNWRLKRGN